MQRLLAADSAGRGVYKAYEYGHIALAGAVPVAAVTSQGSLLRKTADLVLGVAIPLHLHIATNCVVSDYVPKVARLPVRSAVLAMTAVTYLGVMKVNMAGPGLTECVKMLWQRPSKEGAKA